MEKFTPELADMLCEARESGLPVTACADYIGVHRSTIYSWLKRGEKAKSGKYKEFYKKWTEAKGKFILHHLQKINDSKDWKASQYLLAVTEPDVFNTHNWHKVDAQVQQDTHHDLSDLFDEETINEVINEYEKDDQ